MNMNSAAKLVIFSLSVVSSSFLCKLVLASHSNFNLPCRWISPRLWLSPILVCFIVNFIIIAIAATSTFGSFHNDASTPAASTTAYRSKITDNEKERDREQSEIKKAANSISSLSEKEFEKTADQEKTEANIGDARPGYQSLEADSGEKEEENEIDDSMDATWKAIMKAQGKVRSEIWNIPAATSKLIDGGETESVSSAAWKMMEDKSMSEEELKKKAEAFIKKFNDEMRLQREESDQRLMKKMVEGRR